MKKTLHRNEYKILLHILYGIRTNARLRQEDLASRLSVHQSFISKIENGERRLDIIELMDICIAIGVELKDVITEFETQINETKQ